MVLFNHPFLPLFFFLLFLATSTVCIVPLGRDSAAIALLNNTIWIFGGAVSDNMGGFNASSNLYSLDISQSWSTSSPNWIDHDADNNPTIVSSRIRPNMQVGPDGTSLWVYGGITTNTTGANLFLRYDTTNHTWSTVTVAGAIRLEGFSAVKNARGVLFFGGVTDATSLDVWARNDAVIKIDPTMKTWSTTSVANGFPGLVMATTTLVNATKVYIIGGSLQTSTTAVLVSISNITVYDTVAGTWSWSMTTGSQLPLNRSGHSAVLSETNRGCCYRNLGYDGNSIIIFGGNGGNLVGYFNDVWTLDVNLFQWTSRTITGSAPKTGIYGMNSSFSSHKSFVNPFSRPTLGSGPAATYYNDVYVLDTRKWAWKASFTAASVQTPTQTGIVASTTDVSTNEAAPSTNGTNGSNSGIGGIGGIGGLVGIVCGLLSLIGVISLIIWIVRRNRRADAAAKPIENSELNSLPMPNENTVLPELPTKDYPPPNTPDTVDAHDNIADPHSIAVVPSKENPPNTHLPQSSTIPPDANISQTEPATIGAYSAPHQPYYYPAQANANPATPASMYYYPSTPQFQPGFSYPPPLPLPLPPSHGPIFYDNPHAPGDGIYAVGRQYPPPNAYTPSLHHVGIPPPPLYSAYHASLPAQSAEAPRMVSPRPHQIELREELSATRGDA
ncbi:hypothetical protein BC936DRAFT_144914 [Jimgerdemannia flammicorona]|uniref:Galactose oxidase n=1 Tax=Jimgerdemannia flammicorona TaxID=994334 RepID=A0A433DM45_9FUNG|nr:hypothetical protein BC936DRAFT_144914 [Jimgerdemannia flammicorona]